MLSSPALTADPTTAPFWLAAPTTPPMPNLVAVVLGGIGVAIPSWTDFKAQLARVAPGLQILGVINKALQGPVGPIRPYFPALQQLQLGGNQLSGVVPEDLAQYVGQLVMVDLGGNQLRGTLPVGLLQVRNACGSCCCWLLLLAAAAAAYVDSCKRILHDIAIRVGDALM